MKIEVNGVNIDLFALDVLTGNTKEELLRNALEAKKNGHTLTCEIPDELSVNVFDAHGGTPVSPEDLEKGSNPIENSQAEGAASQEQFHVCEFPVIKRLGETFKCRWCRREYFADAISNGADEDVSFQWIIVGEIEG